MNFEWRKSNEKVKREERRAWSGGAGEKGKEAVDSRQEYRRIKEKGENWDFGFWMSNCGGRISESGLLILKMK